MSTKLWYGLEDLERHYGPMTVARYVRAFREDDEVSQTQFAKKLGLSRANLCDIEKGRKTVTPERAAKIARCMGVSEEHLVQLAIDDLLRAARLPYRVKLKKVV